MIDPGGIFQYTGDWGTLSKAVSELRTHAIGIRSAGQDVHSRFQATAAYYKAPEADQLFSSTQPVMDTADEFAAHIESLADALDTFAAEAKPHADRLKHLKEQAIAFVDSVEGDDDWTKDQHKVDTHKALMDGVAEAVAGFRQAEHNAAVKIGAISPAACRPVDDGSGTYSVTADMLKSMPELPWGTPEGRTYDRWSLDWWGHGAKSWVWDGFVKESLWGGFVGLGVLEDNLLGINGSEAQHQTWEGLRRTVVGAYAYGMDGVGLGDHLSDWQRDSKAYAKEFGKQFIAYDEWSEDPARAHAVTSFNVLTVFAGAGGVLAKLGKGGRFVEAAGAVAKVGDALDPVSGAARTARALSDLPKVSEVLTNVGEHLRLPKTRFPDGALDDLSNRYRVDKDGNFIALKPDGTPDTQPVRHEPAAADRVTSPGPNDRELAGVGGRAPDATSHTRSNGARSGPSHGAAHAGGDVGDNAPTASHGPGQGRSGGLGTGIATHHGGNGGGPRAGLESSHGSRGHDAASNGGHHGSADSAIGHGGAGIPHGDQPTGHVESPPGPRPSGHIPETTFEHVLKGELKYGRDGRPKVVGYHFRPGGRDPRGVKVPRILEVDHKTGLTVGDVWMRNPRDGTWVMKRNKSTFFPPTWTERDVRRAMVKSFENSRVVDAQMHKWRGEYKGITFEGYFDPVTGDAITVYPIMPPQ
ncbi:EndoU domain-containing protein [Streptomyces sp. NPDC003487]